MVKGKEEKQPAQPSAGHAQQHKAAGGAPAPYRRGAMAPFRGFEPFSRLREELNRLFDQFSPGWLSPWEGGDGGRGWGLDVHEDEGSVTVRAEAPGFEPSDFDIQVHGDQLVLRAAHKSEKEEKERGLHEWRRQEFYQAVPLPTDIDADKVEATYRNGVLSVTLPKSEQARGRRIQVKT